MLERSMIALKAQDKLEIQTVNGFDLASVLWPNLKVRIWAF